MPVAKSRVAITGGAGFIGRHFSRRFGAMGAAASILDLREPSDPGSHERVVVGDVRDAEAVRAALEGADRVLHLAAAHHDFGIDRETFFSVNEGSAGVLCAVMDELRIRSLCFFSSVAVYGPGLDLPTEETRCRPDSPYGESKLAAESVFVEWAGQGDGRELLVLRPTVTFGPGNFANMYTLIRQVDSGFYLPVGEGANRKSLVYVDNIVDATLALWDAPERPVVRIYNAVDKPDLTSREIETAVFGALGRRVPRFRVPLALATAAALPFDALIALTGWNLPISSARIRKFTEASTTFAAEGWERAGVRGAVTLQEGIGSMVEWYTKEGRRLPVDRSVPPPHPVPLASIDGRKP